MTILRPEPLPYFWHVSGQYVQVVRSLQDAGFSYRSKGVWCHRKTHSMFLWKLTNTELINAYQVKIYEYHYNVRKHKPRKSKKVIDSAKQIRYVVECKQ